MNLIGVKEMKEQKLYVCEFCGTQYGDKSKAKICEDNHKKVRKLPIQNTWLTNQIIQEDRKKYVLSLMTEVRSGIQECNHLWVII